MKLDEKVPAGFCRLKLLAVPPELSKLIFPVAAKAVCEAPPEAVAASAVDAPVPVAVLVTESPVAVLFVAPPVEVITAPAAFASFAPAA